TDRVSVGRRSLLGAEAGIGIALGDDCVVEAGLYVTAGTKVILVGEEGASAGEPHTVKARDLSGVSNLLFRRNSLTGAVKAVARECRTVELNAALHANCHGPPPEAPPGGAAVDAAAAGGHRHGQLRGPAAVRVPRPRGDLYRHRPGHQPSLHHGPV